MKRIQLWLVVLIFIFLTGAAFRLVGINWDQNQHLHPDERFLTMVTEGIIWPRSLAGYFSTATSTANPHNIGFPFYVYGTLPVFITKLLSQLVGLHSYNGLVLVGRFVSAGLDTLVIGLVWAVTFHLTGNKLASMLSALFYSLSVLPIQLSHFYAVDTFMVAGLYGSFYFLHQYLRSGYLLRPLTFAGILFGLSVASKISAVLFLPVVASTLLINLVRTQNWPRVAMSGLVFVFMAFVALRITQPYMFSSLFSVNPKVIADWQQLKSFDDPKGWFPSGRAMD